MALKISLFGPFHVILDGQIVTQFRSDPIRALFTYLVMDAGTPYRREALAGLLWPDKPEATALHNLRQALNVLRKVLGDKQADRPFLEITRKNVQFNPNSDYWLDVKEFTTQIAEVKAQQHYRLWGGPHSIERLQQVAKVYRGDFLSGFSLNTMPFEEWVVAKREQFHRQALDAFQILANYHERRQEYAEAQRYARRQIELEAWREEAHRQLMRAFALNGQRNAALLQYQKCTEILAEELGVEPEDNTKALYEQIKAGQFAEAGGHYLRSVPPQRTPFIGRKSEVEELIRRLVNPTYRLLTLVGEGGIGKTRLALVATEEVAAGFAEGACFVSLANVATNGRKKEPPHYVLATAIGNALDLQFQSRRTVDSQLLAYLRPKELLLVLDNFEHLLPDHSCAPISGATYQGSADLILEILQKAPQVVLLITSRTRLNFQAEYVIQISGLPVPSLTDAQASTYSSVRLFCERASRTWQGFTLDEKNLCDVIRVCELVQGNPLGIELAAAWIEHFTVAEMVQAIQEDLDFLAATRQDIPTRHRSMRAVFEQSWKRLNEPEKHAFRKLSIFQGDFDRKAARQVANTSISLLSSLMNKSFIHRSGRDRYYIHDRLKQFGHEKLAEVPQEENKTRDRHCTYFTTWLQQQEPARNYGQALSKIAQEIDNVRLAWQWAVEHAKIDGISVSLESLFYFYKIRSWFQEGEAAFAQAAASTRSVYGSTTRLYNKLVARQGVFCHDLGRYDEGKAFLQSTLSVVRTVSDKYETAFCLTSLARVAISQGEYPTAQNYLSEAIKLAGQVPLSEASRAACLALEADSLRELGIVCWNQGDYAGAKKYYEQARRIYQNPRVADQNGEAWALNKLGCVSWGQGEYRQAKHYYEQALLIFQRIGNRRGEGSTTNELGMVFEREGDYAGAKANYKQALHIFHELGDQQGEGDTLINLGFVNHHQGDYIDARRYFEQALDIFHLLGYQRGEGLALAFLSLTSHQLGNHDFAQQYAQRALQITQDTGDRTIQGYALTHLGHALMARNHLTEAADFYQQAMSLRHTLGKANLAMESLAGLAHVSLAQGDLLKALAYTEEILRHLAHNTLEGAVEPLRVYLSCIRVLQANQDPRAKEMLQRAYELLKERAAKISRKSVQRSFLENVTAHREIVCEFNRLADS